MADDREPTPDETRIAWRLASETKRFLRGEITLEEMRAKAIELGCEAGNLGMLDDKPELHLRLMAERDEAKRDG